MSQCPLALNVLAKRTACPGQDVCKTHAAVQMSSEAAVIHKHAERRLGTGTPGVFCGAAQVSGEHRLHRETGFQQG